MNEEKRGIRQWRAGLIGLIIVITAIVTGDIEPKLEPVNFCLVLIAAPSAWHLAAGLFKHYKVEEKREDAQLEQSKS
jgi:hypothetical protein